LFRGFNAYEGGNYALWALNKLCNANKHRLLIPVGVFAQGMVFTRHLLVDGEVFAPQWNREKMQVEFARIQPGGSFDYNAQVSIHIAFDEFNGVKGGPAVGILKLMERAVRRVLNATEEE